MILSVIFLALLSGVKSGTNKIKIDVESKEITTNLNRSRFDFQFDLKIPDLSKLQEKDQTKFSEFLIGQAYIKPGFKKVDSVSIGLGNNEESTWIGLGKEIFTINRTPMDTLIIYDKNGVQRWTLEE